MHQFFPYVNSNNPYYTKYFLQHFQNHQTLYVFHEEYIPTQKAWTNLFGIWLQNIFRWKINHLNEIHYVPNFWKVKRCKFHSLFLMKIDFTSACWSERVPMSFLILIWNWERGNQNETQIYIYKINVCMFVSVKGWWKGVEACYFMLNEIDTKLVITNLWLNGMCAFLFIFPPIFLSHLVPFVLSFSYLCFEVNCSSWFLSHLHEENVRCDGDYLCIRLV